MISIIMTSMRSVSVRNIKSNIEPVDHSAIVNIQKLCTIAQQWDSLQCTLSFPEISF